jgi:hypothetical protein
VNPDTNTTPGAERHVELGPYVVRVAENAGPRILGITKDHGPNLFAHLPDAVIDEPGLDPYRFLGGHRLWRAPEVPEATYQPDDSGVVVSFDGDKLSAAGLPDRDGVEKRMVLQHRDNRLIVDHELANAGSRPIDVAPWAITQFAPGGVAYLPHSTQPTDLHGVQPNRDLVLWPYTDLGAPEFGFSPSFTTVAASERRARTKIGLSNTRGWIAYAARGVLFVKWSPVHVGGEAYADRDASVQCYRDERFLELETLGPLTSLQPGRTVLHREVWALMSADGQEVDEMLMRLAPDPVTMQL